MPEAGAVASDASVPEPAPLERLRGVMHAIRTGCPWDAEQTHRSLAKYVIEESAEAVEAIEAGTDADLCEELGDVLLQVYFHAEIAAEEGRFNLDDVATGIADKLVHRHPYVFSGAVVPDDLNATWEQRKRADKGRSSALDGIPPLDAVARASKVVGRARAHGVPVDLPSDPVGDDVGEQIVALIARAQASGIDADQAVRDAVRALETSIRAAESSAHTPDAASLP